MAIESRDGEECAETPSAAIEPLENDQVSDESWSDDPYCLFISSVGGAARGKNSADRDR